MVKEKKIRKVFEEIYQEQLAKHRRGGTIQNLCRVIKTHCVLNGYSTLWIEIQQWFKPERYGLTELYYTIDVNTPTPIEMIPYEDRDRYFLDMEVKAWWLINLQRWYVFFYEKNGRRVRGVLGKDRTKDLLRSIL